MERGRKNVFLRADTFISSKLQVREFILEKKRNLVIIHILYCLPSITNLIPFEKFIDVTSKPKCF